MVVKGVSQRDTFFYYIRKYSDISKISKYLFKTEEEDMVCADYILTGNAIFDSVEDKPFMGFVAVKGNRIVAIGKGCMRHEQFTGHDTEIIDCGDRLVMPGMIDAHMHFFDGIFQNSRFMCRDLFECRSARECVDAIGAFAKAHPDHERIVGMGWFPAQWDDKTEPTKKMLDEIEADRPVYLMSADGHSFWLNSRAMEESEIDPDRKLLFGAIVKDENGEATGVMHEMDACAVCSQNAQRLPASEREALVLDFVKVLIRHGITSATDITVLPTPLPVTEEVETVAHLEEEGRLNLRLNLYPPMGVTDDFSTVDEYRRRFHSDKLRVAGLKAFVDGVHGNHTALLMEPYLDEPDKTGESFYHHDHYVRQVNAANRAGYGVKLHCCGEGAVVWALDAYENSAANNDMRNIRNSIEHAETVAPEICNRFAKYDVTATMQPLHLMYEGELLTRILGEKRAEYQYAIKTMLDDGVNLAFSSDYPVAEFDPMINIYFAVTRCDREGTPIEKESTQKISVAQAIRAYTYGSAYCVGMERKVGTLEVGKLADIVVLDRNIFDTDVKEILETQVLLAMVDGEIAYNEIV